MGCMAVVCGAFAAHGLGDFLLDKYAGVEKEQLGETIPGAQKYLADFKTAAEYQMSHALALIGVGLIPASASRHLVNLAGWAFLLGIVLFSGSLYLLVLTGQTKLGMITPLGGVLFLVGWISLALALVEPRRPAAAEK